MKRAKAKYVLGLTATPIRRDDRQPILFMQCGPMRHTTAKPEGAPQVLEVAPRFLCATIVAPPDAGIEEIFRTLALDGARTARIAAEITAAGAPRARCPSDGTARLDDQAAAAVVPGGDVLAGSLQRP